MISENKRLIYGKNCHIKLKACPIPLSEVDFQTTNRHVAHNHQTIRNNWEKINQLEREYDIL
jgi:hypothetical protein